MRAQIGGAERPVSAGSAEQASPMIRLVWVSCVAALIAVFDQLSKVWAVNLLIENGVSRVDLMAFVDIVYARNTGVNFGVLASESVWQPFVLAGFAVAVSIALLVWSIRTDDARIALGAAVLIGGALGNAYDRVVEGAVIDFLNVSCCGIDNPFAFNGADAAIFLGAAVILFATWRN